MILAKMTRESLRDSAKRLAKARGVEESCLESLPVEIRYGKTVPVSGSVHISMGRTVSRATINKLFSK